MAESFGTDPERYDRARPRYPGELIARIAGPGREVLDVGCGTGIASRQLRDAGCAVLGVDPDERMAAFARRSGVEVEVARFEDWDPAGRTFDLVVAAQTWHWVDPVAGAAKAARVLRPEGRLAVFGHAFRLPPEVARAFAEVYRRAVPGSPFSAPQADRHEEVFDKAADGIRQAGGFGAVERWRFDWEQHYTRDAWLDQLSTTGMLTWLPEDKQAEVLDGAGAVLDALGGGFTMPGSTIAMVAARES
ncbi:class I SAM-dependent methyltransferase [Saccharopolyspora taberi]|uniref:Class I SAM-dependent methyltransferase n=1 Tax=Saccharopolyspora taberi TaxID=60895 RepID=A0ABN3VCZ5_9PSEU